MLELLQARPLEQITIGDIVAAAGIGYTTFFRHYPSKDALLEDLAAEEIGCLFDLTLPLFDPADSLEACLAVCTYLDQRRPLWRALLTGGAAGTVREEFLRRAREAAVGRPQGGRLPVDLALVLAVTITIQVLDWWLRQAEPWPAARVAEIISRFNRELESSDGLAGADPTEAGP
ncbi:TetR/AcrR family transcriptional regulator [Phenylobacterium sp. LjRoot225]|uniref:TetR/AcrR family transcriptional regulator n=1 Tax=Phenylobacterium sp. LjRoot225 TaxID=3342285 RepID=UPI003ECCFB8F